MKEENINPELLECIEDFTDQIVDDLFAVIEAYFKLNPYTKFNLSESDYNSLKVTNYSNAIYRLFLSNLSALDLIDFRKFAEDIKEAVNEILIEKENEKNEHTEI